jgi:2-desacetyl-2-hydroxyethyl bacteriochlorophyllide A dehydrogenase
MVHSIYISFPQANEVVLREEQIGPPGPGQILCRAESSLISIGTESYCLRGVFDPGTNWARWVQYPFRPGYSMVARVVALGSGVDPAWEGWRVLIPTPHQQYTLTTPERAYGVPEGVSAEEAAWGPLASTTQLAVRRAQLALGETVGVVGLGMLGQLVTQYLHVAGARKVIAIDTVQGRLGLALAHGATHALCDTAEAARPAVEELTGGRMLDAVWDVTGHPAVLSQCVQLLRRLGRVVLTGDTPTPTQQFLGPGVLSNAISILGIHASVVAPHFSEHSPWTEAEIIALFYDYILQGRMRVRDLITHRHAPAEAPEVYRRLQTERAGSIGVIFDWSRV